MAVFNLFAEWNFPHEKIRVDALGENMFKKSNFTQENPMLQ